MRRLLTALVLAPLAACACGDSGADTAAVTTTTSTSTTTTEPIAATTEMPDTFCGAITQANSAFDDLTRTMLATMSGDPSGPFIVAVEDTVAILGQAESLAPPEAADAAALLATAYRDFESMLFEVDFVPDAIPADDPRATALTDDAFRNAVSTVTEVCP